MANSEMSSTADGRLFSILATLCEATPAPRRVVRYPAGNVLLVEGEPATEVHVIVSGAVKLVRTMTDTRDVTIGIRWPGSVLGVAPAVLGIPHPCRAVTMVPSEIRPVSASLFNDLASHDERLREAVTWLLSYELVRFVRRFSWHALDVRDRLELLLRDLAQSHGQVLDGAARIPLPLTHEDLADLIVASRESVSRAMKILRQAGRITREDGWLVVSQSYAPGRAR